MRLSGWLLLLSPAVVAAGPAPVVGGENAPAGKWPDVAAVFIGGQQACTGTLIAPNIVITAGHCNDPSLDSVLLGTNSLARPGDGETITVMRRIEYPASQTSEDVTVLVLAHDAAEAPRAIASGWAKFDIANGAAVEFVGYGAIDKLGNNYIDDLQQAQSTITDYNCSTSSGCNVAARPDGELGAGGMGIDTCSGDSGGPMYLLADYGTFLAGVTSRSYDNAGNPCGEGGIYERPDKLVPWIEQQTGVAVTHGPEPTAPPLQAVPGGGAEAMIAVNDPKGSDHTFAISTPPAHGTAVVRDDGRIRVCTDPAVTSGDDSVGVTVTDSDHPEREVAIAIPIQLVDGNSPGSCDVNAFEVGAGCCDAGRSASGSIPLALGVLLMLRRRRDRVRSARGRDLAQV